MTWDVVPFESLYAVPSRSGLTKPKRVRGEGVKMVNMGELFANDRISDPPMERVPLTDRERERALLQTGDLLFARQSLVAEGAGKCSIVLAVPEPTTFESHLFRVRLAADRASPSFYYYYYASPQGKGNIQSLVIQVAAAGIRGSELARLTVPCPPLDVQHKIASILSAYDDLIENNLRRIQILEEMAQALYREWFVEFRFPGHERIGVKDSALGPIPTGWSVRTIGDICSRVQAGGTPSRKKPQYWEDGAVDWYKTKELQDGFLFDSEERLSEAAVADGARLFDAGTVLMAIYGSPTVGRLGILTRQASCNQAALAVIPNCEVVTSSFLYHLLWSKRQHFNTIAQGAAQQNISKQTVVETRCIVPGRDVVAKFDDLASPSLALRQALEASNRNLRCQKDLLLPKLISGELDVSGLDLDVGEAA